MVKLSSEEVAKRYDDFANWYDFAEIFTNLVVGRQRKKIVKSVSGNVLEVGIGTGANLRYYSKDVKLSGVDISKKMLSKAIEKSKKLGLKVNFMIGKSEKLPFGDGDFDYVIDTLGMCSYSDPVKAVKEMKRVCKKGGKIILFEHGVSSNDFIRRMQEKREEKHYNKIGCTLLHDYNIIMKKAGINGYKIQRSAFGILWTIRF